MTWTDPYGSNSINIERSGRKNEDRFRFAELSRPTSPGFGLLTHPSDVKVRLSGQEVPGVEGEK